MLNCCGFISLVFYSWQKNTNKNGLGNYFKKKPNILIALFYIFLHIVWREPDGTIVGSSNTYKYSMWIPRVCVCMRRVRRKPNAICLSLSGAILRVNSLYHILKYELSLGKYTWWPKSKSVMFLRKLCYLVSL